METITRRSWLASMAAAPALVSAAAASDWIPLFDGKSLKGWKASENSGSWKVVDGLLTGDGSRSHLFYSGPVKGADFKNFELKVEARARARCNSGVYFHTQFQETGFPQQGFEVQVNNTALGEGTYRERKKTASLYGVRNVYKQFVRDDEWFTLLITVRGRRVEIRLNDMLMVDYVEPQPPVPDSSGRGRVLQHGTFALQCHDPGSKVAYRSVLVRPLPDQAPALPYQPVVDDLYKEIRELGAQNYPVVDYHVHLKGGWTLEQALENSRRVGIQYGIAVNCGLHFPVESNEGVKQFLDSMRGQPCFFAMQAEGREWVKMFSPQAVAQFDYVFTDSMTFEHEGRRMRLWLPDEVGKIADPDRFMDVIVDKTVGILNREPIDIYVNPTFLPDQMSPDYDRYWTEPRMDRVIEAAVKNGVAIEINNRYKIPSAKFISRAKAAGAKFTFGTNNTDANLGRSEYGLAMVKQCGLKWADFFTPKPDGEKPVQKKGMPKA